MTAKKWNQGPLVLLRSSLVKQWVGIVPNGCDPGQNVSNTANQCMFLGALGCEESLIYLSKTACDQS